MNCGSNTVAPRAPKVSVRQIPKIAPLSLKFAFYCIFKLQLSKVGVRHGVQDPHGSGAIDQKYCIRLCHRFSFTVGYLFD